MFLIKYFFSFDFYMTLKTLCGVTETKMILYKKVCCCLCNTKALEVRAEILQVSIYSAKIG